MGQLSRSDLVRVIEDERGSVIVNGRIISRVQDLPSEADLAQGNPEAESAAAAALRAQIAAMQAQLDTLTSQQQPAPDAATPGADQGAGTPPPAPAAPAPAAKPAPVDKGK